MRALGLWILAVCAAGCLVPGDPVLGARDTSPPLVQHTFPANNGVLPRDGEVRITFSAPMDERTLLPGISLLEGGRTPVALDVFVPPPGVVPEPVQPEAPYTVRVRPSRGPLAGETSYTLVLSTVLTDRGGNPLAEGIQVTFFTAP